MVVYLNHFSLNQVLELLPDRFSGYKEIAIKAYEYHCKIKLKYNTKTGKAFNSDLGLISSFTSKLEIPVYDQIDSDLLSDCFMPEINNSISRNIRGFEF